MDCLGTLLERDACIVSYPLSLNIKEDRKRRRRWIRKARLEFRGIAHQAQHTRNRLTIASSTTMHSLIDKEQYEVSVLSVNLAGGFLLKGLTGRTDKQVTKSWEPRFVSSLLPPLRLCFGLG